MIKFRYVLTRTAADTVSLGHLYWMIQIEGDLEIVIDGRVCLICEAELLLAFAIILRRWLRLLKHDPKAEFCYISMDRVEEPILKFTSVAGSDKWNLESALENQLEPVLLEDILQATNEFLASLEAELSDHPVDLGAEYQEHIDDFLRETYPDLEL